MTKEEILRGIPDDGMFLTDDYYILSRFAIRAMEEYAEQQCQKQLREELIGCLSYYHFTINDELTHDLIVTVVDDYLKQKGLPL